MSSVRICKLWLTENERRIDVRKKVGVQLPEKEKKDAGQTMTRYLLPQQVLSYQWSFPPTDYLA